MDIEWYRQRLLTIEQALVQKLERDVESARETIDDQPDPGDQGTVEELRSEYFSLAETDSEILANVRAALRRIDEGTFGRCVVDGGPIEEKRLQAVPWTPYCVKHQQQAEESAGLRMPRT
jgi:DnaK suppressor protein